MPRLCDGTWPKTIRTNSPIPTWPPIKGYLDDVVDPAETRPMIIKALEMLRNKRDNLPAKKHGNIPL